MCDCYRTLIKAQLIVKNTPDGLNDQLAEAVKLGYHLRGDVIQTGSQWAQMVVKYALEEPGS